MNPVTKIVIIVGIHFLILFTALIAFQNIFTKIFQEKDNFSIGPFMFIFNYGVFMIANLFAPLIRYSSKWLISISALGYACQYAVGIFISDLDTSMQYFIAAIGASIAGVFASLLWVNVGTYIHDTCHFYNEIEKKGHYFGLFTTLYSFCLITGSLVVTFGLSLMQQKNYFILVTAIAVLAFLFSSLFMKDIKQSRDTKDISNLSLKQIFSSTLKYYPNMVSVLGMIALYGFNIGVQTSTLLRLIPITNDKKQDLLHSGFCIISSGVGAFFGGYLGGKLCDKFDIKLISTASICLNAIVFGLILFASLLQELAISLIVSFIFGFQFYFLTGCLMVVCSRIFKGDSESFAIVQQFHCLLVVLYEVFAIATKNSVQIKYIMIVLMILCIPALIGIRKLPQEQSTNVIPNSHRETQITKGVDEDFD